MRELLNRGPGLLIVSLLFCCLWLLPAEASPITFTFTGEGSVTWVDSPFTDTSFRIVIHADTNNVDETTVYGPGVPVIFGLSGTIVLTGMGTGSFVQPLYVFNNKAHETVGFESPPKGGLIWIHVLGVGLNTYDLRSSFDPISNSSTDLLFLFQNVELDIGNLTFSSMNYATFSATMVQLPSTFLLLSSGLLGLAGWRRFRKS